MAIGTITMILANVGLSIFNNWAGSRQNKQIAEKREEFERAAREGQRERMLQLMREGQQLTLELEEQKHKERLSELNDQFDNLIKELAYSAAIEHWPLKTLPIVMKNQALGNLLANQEEKVALHCILTSSNCREFNDYVLPKVESALEAYCNVHWSTLTGSPVLFYSGAWKSNDVPTGTQVDSMRAALSNLPTLLITPFFRPQDHKLVFQAHIWGVGYNNSDQFTIPVIEPTEFQRDYTDELGWLAEDGLIEEAVEDLVPYLQCLIGYIADTYFWSAFGSVPQLPRMLTDGTINTDGMKYLVDDTRMYYKELLTSYIESDDGFSKSRVLNMLDGSESLLENSDAARSLLEKTFLTLCYRASGYRFETLEDLCVYLGSLNNEKNDFFEIIILKQLYIIKKIAQRKNIKSKRIETLYKSLNCVSKEQFEIVDSSSFDIKQFYCLAQERMYYAANPTYFVFIVWNRDVVIGTFCSEDYKPCVFYKSHTVRYFIVTHVHDIDKVVNQNKNKWNRQYYFINLLNKKLSQMKDENFEKQFGHSFERIGKGLGKIFDGFTNRVKASPADNLWGENVAPAQKNLSEQIVSYFIANAGKTIPAERVEEMSMQTVLNWVDENVTPFADKVYLVKGINQEYKKHVFCVFFSAGDKVLINDENPRICFITSQYNEEMRQTFNGNNICEIPLK